MDILQLRARNINSLYGNWSIDFQVPEYREQGIFALVGPTGSGKTSILDSICLALYGQTPRLGSITKNQNHIMSRGTGDCFAEVIFQVPSGKYRAFWSQTRARNKCDGNLQAPKHELSLVKTGEILAERISTVPQLVEKLNGLDFSRFTRSILLPQGEFANFLEANEDMRSPILEKITGTHIYSLISQRIYDMVKELHAELDGLRSLKESISLLTDEQIEEIEQRKNDTQTKLTKITAEIKDLEKKAYWREEIHKYQSEQNKYQIAVDTTIQEMTHLSDEKTRYQRARHAARISPYYTQFTECTQKIAEIEQKITTKTAEISTNSLTVQQVETQITAITQEKTQKEMDKKIFDAIMPRVLFLDSAITQNTFHQNNLLQMQEEYQTEYEQKKHLIESTAGQYAELQQNIQSLHHAIQEIDPHNTLSATTELLHTQSQRRKELLTQLYNLEAETQQLAQIYEEKLLIFTRDSAQVETDQQEIIRAQADIEQLKQDISQLLQAENLMDWENKLHQMHAVRYDLEKIQHIQDEQTKLQEILQSLIVSKGKRTKEVVDYNVQLQKITVSLQKKEKSLSRWRSQCETINKQLTVHMLQVELQAGDACSVCGSEEHPYMSEKNFVQENAMKLNSRLDQLREKITSGEKENSVLADQKNNFALEIAKINLLIEKENTEFHTIEDQIAIITTEIEKFWIDFHPRALDWDVPSHLLSDDVKESAQIGRFLEEQCQEIESIISMVKKYHIELQNQQQILVNCSNTHNINLRAAHNSQLELQLAVQKQEQLEQNLGILTEEIHGIENDMLAAASENPAWARQHKIVDFRRSSVRGFEEISSWFDHQVHELIQHTAKIAEYTQNAHDIFREITLYTRQYDELSKAMEQYAEQIKTQDTQLARLHTRRQALFGNKNLMVEEKYHQERLRMQEREINLLVQQSVLLTQDIHNGEVLLQELAMEHEKMHTKAVQQSAAFLAQLQTHDFIDVNDFITAQIPEAEIILFEESYTQLEKNLTQMQAVLAKITQDLQLLEAQQLTEQSSDELMKDNLAAKQLQAVLNEEWREIDNQLSHNTYQVSQYNSLYHTIQSTQEKNQVWYALNDLIGSRDGKAYRNFAQGLTFQLLIHNANVQLARMSDRYILMADPNKALELKVIDQYLAGEARSTKNLSGGESFIVSLALALGLANISQMNVPIDSLFLDEGFGTLDEEALDHALDALALLQTEGKKIGIISHIPMLKERIAVHIQVDPIGGAKSKISGPGCVHSLR